MSIYVITAAMVACLAAGLWFLCGVESANETESTGPASPPDDHTLRGLAVHGGVLPYAATCVAIVLIVAAVYSW